MDESLSQPTTPEPETVTVEPRRTPAPVLRWARSHRAKLICAALLGVMSVQLLAAISRKSITTDEVVGTYLPDIITSLSATSNFSTSTRPSR